MKNCIIILLSLVVFSCGKNDISLDSYGPPTIVAGKDFNLQPSGENAIWMNANGATIDTVAVLNGTYLQSFIQDNGNLVTAVVPKNLFQTPGTYELYLLDKKNQKKSNSINLIVK